jgi:hypothetical protein
MGFLLQEQLFLILLNKWDTVVLALVVDTNPLVVVLVVLPLQFTFLLPLIPNNNHPHLIQWSMVVALVLIHLHLDHLLSIIITSTLLLIPTLLTTDLCMALLPSIMVKIAIIITFSIFP